MYEKIRTEGAFPKEGRGVVISIFKPGKNPAIAASYRPISFLCKVLERTINKRLVHIIEELIKIIGYADDWMVHTTHQRVTTIRMGHSLIKKSPNYLQKKCLVMRIG
jgi:hypothetical protein